MSASSSSPPISTITEARDRHGGYTMPATPSEDGSPDGKDGFAHRTGMFPSRYSMQAPPSPPGSPPASSKFSRPTNMRHPLTLSDVEARRYSEDLEDDVQMKTRRSKFTKRANSLATALTSAPQRAAAKVNAVIKSVRFEPTILDREENNSAIREKSESSHKGQRKVTFGSILLTFSLVFALYRLIDLGADVSSLFSAKDSLLSASSAVVKRTAITLDRPAFVPVKSTAAARRKSVKGYSPKHPIDNHGRLHVDPSLPVNHHPIYQLIQDARTKWDLKVARQSKTLKQAVAEYKRRNRNRNPPKGFDKWWKFVVENNVQLPDEYDRINEDLKLFRALSPADLNRRIDDASYGMDSFTVEIQDGEITNRTVFRDIAFEGAFDRVEGQINLLKDFGIEQWMPDLRAVYSLHDTPQGFIGWDHRRDLLERYEDGEYYEPGEVLDATQRGWAAACPPSSAARHFNKYVTPVNEGKTFIANHALQFDLCENPSVMVMHGVTVGRSPNVDGELKATFSLSKTNLHTDVLAVPVEQWVDELPNIPWNQKTQNKLMWRGANTGIFHSRKTHWRDSHRTRLVRDTSHSARGKVELLPPPRSSKPAASIQSQTITTTAARIHQKMFDVAFAGEPIQCDVSDGTCQELRDDYNFQSQHMTFEEALEYKYVIDIDGNAWSARTKRLFAGGHLVFKSTIMPEWWTQRVAPWVHYIPIKVDYSDLHDALVFFRGDHNGKGGEEQLAKQIAEAGLEWSQTHWRRVDMAAYLSRLYLEWARLLAPNRDSMDFVYDPSMELTRS